MENNSNEIVDRIEFNLKMDNYFNSNAKSNLLYVELAARTGCDRNIDRN